jgi:hypothetical protein
MSAPKKYLGIWEDCAAPPAEEINGRGFVSHSISLFRDESHRKQLLGVDALFAFQPFYDRNGHLLRPTDNVYIGILSTSRMPNGTTARAGDIFKRAYEKMANVKGRGDGARVAGDLRMEFFPNVESCQGRVYVLSERPLGWTDKGQPGWVLPPSEPDVQAWLRLTSIPEFKG